MSGSRQQGPKSLHSPLAPRANPARPGPRPPAVVVPARPASFVVPGIRPPAQPQIQRQTTPFVKAPTPPGLKGPVVRSQAPPVYRPFAAAHVQPTAVPAAKSPVPPPVFKPQLQTLQPRLAPRVTSNIFRTNAPGFHNPGAVQRSCLFSWCRGGGSDGDKRPPDKESNENLITTPKKQKPFERCVTIAEGLYDELVEGDVAEFRQITSCTAVYVRSEAGRVVIYHWPKTALTTSSKLAFDHAVASIGATGHIAQIKLFTKSKVDLGEFIEYLKPFCVNVEVDLVNYQTEPWVLFNGTRYI